MGWDSPYYLEKLLDCLVERNESLTKWISLSRAETQDCVDEIHEACILSDVFDESWVNELHQRYLMGERSVIVGASEDQVEELTAELAQLCETEAQLVEDRKKYAGKLLLESQLIHRHRARYEEVSHHLNVFSTGVALLTTPPHSSSDGGDPLTPVAEQMRCSYNELRRVNASLEEKLVMTGIAKRKILSDIGNLLSNLRENCAATRPKGEHDDADDGSICIPKVPSLSGEATHNDLLSCMSVSFGHFASECINDIADVALSNHHHLEKECLLVGVLSVESNRYKSIAASLKAAIHDSQGLLLLDLESSVNKVISKACETVRKRLGCTDVTFWTISTGENKSTGIGSSCSGIVECKAEAPFFFMRNMTDTMKFDEKIDVLPPDLKRIILKLREKENEMTKQPARRIEAFAVNKDKSGMTVIRDDLKDVAFLPFSGIYADQLFRRMVSAIAPLQELQLERTAAQRPLHLVECMFELRNEANSPTDLIKLVSLHFNLLFKGSDVEILFPLEEEEPAGHLLCLSVSREPIDFCESFSLDDSRIPKKFQSNYQDVISRIKAPHRSTHLHEVSGGGRPSTLFFISWNNACSVDEAGMFYDPENPTHKSILDTYANTILSLLGNWFGTIFPALATPRNLVSFQVEKELESLLIRKLISP